MLHSGGIIEALTALSQSLATSFYTWLGKTY